MYLYDRQSSARGALRFAPERLSLQGLGWTLPDVATRQAQVDAIVSPGTPGHCRVAAHPQLKPIGAKLHIDIGGEGRYTDAYNLNPTSKGTVPPWANQPIPNHVCGVGENIPVPSSTVDYITEESTPISEAMVSEIARVIKKTGHIRLVNPKNPENRRWHQRVANASGLPYPATLPEEVNIRGVSVYVSRIGTHWKDIPLRFSTRYVFDSHIVRPGEWLSTIAERRLGDLNRWREIYAINSDSIGLDPNLIKVGQLLWIPRS
jgi:hypothetical protein